ncbi:hypothetical protein L195_g051816, partial [Trifolium pratense]
MNPYDFYYLEDFLKFSPVSPNYGNLNMVSEPRFRSPRKRLASAIVPVPENSSIAYQEEVYTVLFDPPSFLMVHSIFYHLWKKSKMEKKFLPLPPLRTSIYIQESSCNSISEAEDEISSSSTCVLESIISDSSFNFSFGNFNSESVPIKLIKAVKPQIEGCAIKIGEIACSLASFNISKTSQSMNTTMKV